MAAAAMGVAVRRMHAAAEHPPRLKKLALHPPKSVSSFLPSFLASSPLPLRIFILVSWLYTKPYAISHDWDKQQLLMKNLTLLGFDSYAMITALVDAHAATCKNLQGSFLLNLSSVLIFCRINPLVLVIRCLACGMGCVSILTRAIFLVLVR